MRLKSSSILVCLLLQSLLPVQPLSAQDNAPGFADAVLGRWDMVVHGPGGDYPSWLEIRLRREDHLMGRFVGRFGSVRHITELEYVAGALRFAVPVQYEPMESDLVFSGRLENGLLSGTTVDPSGERVNWSAGKAPVLDADLTGSIGRRVALIQEDSLAGWRPRFDNRPGCWEVRNGMLSATPPCVDLVTEETFSDFNLSLEVNCPPGCNSGIYLRGRYEVQIQDTAGMAVDALRMGGIYGFIAPMHDAARPAGEWQRIDITLAGRRVTVILNGEIVVNNNVIPGITGGALDSDEGRPGPLMLQGDHSAVQFRNIVLTELNRASGSTEGTQF